MKITKQYLRSLIVESLQEMEDNTYTSQEDIDNPILASVRTASMMLEDYMLRNKTSSQTLVDILNLLKDAIQKQENI